MKQIQKLFLINCKVTKGVFVNISFILSYYFRLKVYCLPRLFFAFIAKKNVLRLFLIISFDEKFFIEQWLSVLKHDELVSIKSKKNVHTRRLLQNEYL